MSLNRNNTKRTLVYAGMERRVTLLKRNYDQQEGTVVALTLFRCYRSEVQKMGQPIERDWSVDSRTTWVIPSNELKRVGVRQICVDDRIVSKSDDGQELEYWQPEAEQMINLEVFSNFQRIECVMINPPHNNPLV